MTWAVNPETDIQDNIRLGVAAETDTTLFRCNVGMGWAGGPIIRGGARPRTVTLGPGDALVRNAHPLHAGLIKGNGDLIGWTAITVTPEMVGQRVAVFTSLEVKTATGRFRAAQQNFRTRVREAGGIAEVARSPEVAVALLREAWKCMKS